VRLQAETKPDLQRLNWILKEAKVRDVPEVTEIGG
jgi:hypothetical protein